MTCLVGKNESGKTALLEALYKLNPVDPPDGNFQYVLEYPRQSLMEYEAAVTAGGSQANVLRTEWSLDEDDVAAVTTVLGPKALTNHKVTISRGYSNQNLWTLNIDEPAVVEFVLSNADLAKADAAPLQKAGTISELITVLKERATPTERQKALLESLTVAFKRGTATLAAIDILAPRMPKFLLFSSYSRLPGKVSIQELQRRQSQSTLVFEDRMFLALLAQAGTKPEEIQTIQQFEPFIAKLEGISNRISNQIFRYWSQNRHLKVRFYLERARPGDTPPFNEGEVFRIRIENTRYGVTVDFDERSTGFVWFFSFLIWFSQVKANYGDRLVILLDEPGLTLHGRAQGDLLRYFREQLVPNYQVIYTTHSPFMIDANNLLSARTVEDVVVDNSETGEIELLGTKVGSEVLSADRDTLFPLQAALGYDITQTLFVGRFTLLVEGPSDLLYLKWFQRELKQRGRTTLDPRWTIAPVGGVEKISTFAALRGGQQLHMAALVDFASGAKGRVDQLRKTQLLRAGHVLTAEAYAEQAEADVEDIIGRETYIGLVNLAYSLTRKNLLPTSKPAAAPIRVVKEIEDHFRVLPPSVPEFDHYSPSVFLTEHVEEGRQLPGIEQALGRFENLFKDLNALLP